MTGFLNRIPLSATFLADGVFSLLAAAVCIFFAGPLATLSGPDVSPSIFTAVGIGLFGWGLFHIAAGRSNGGPSSLAARISMIGDILWIAASVAILLLAGTMLTGAGIALVVIAMITVADILLLKAKGFGRQHAATP